MRSIAIVAVVAVLAAFVAFAQPSPKYIINGAGQDYPTPPQGYTMASLVDLTSSDFINFYNANQLTDGNETLDGCCLFNSSDGFLVSGSGSNLDFIVPFSGGQMQCLTNLQNPVYLGCLPGMGSCGGQQFNTLTPAIVAQLNATYTVPSSVCGPITNVYAIYVAGGPGPNPSGSPGTPEPFAVPFVIYGVGTSYTPPTNYVLASLADLNSPLFVSFYNNNQGLADLPNTNLDGCCIFNVSDGYLTYGSNTSSFSYLAPYTPGGMHQCASQLSNPVMFGCAEDFGPYAGQFIGNLTSSVLAMIGADPELDNGLGCSGLTNVFGIYKWSFGEEKKSSSSKKATAHHKNAVKASHGGAARTVFPRK